MGKQQSDYYDQIIFFLSHGKKELWETVNKDLRDSRRCRLYYHLFPEEILGNDILKIDSIGIRVLSNLYNKLHYPKLTKNELTIKR